MINVVLVFAISGMWHGNSLVFLLWGLWHGVWCLLSPADYKNKLQKGISTVITFVIVMFGWITFKLESLADIGKYVCNMFRLRLPNMDMITDAVMPFSNDYSSVAKFITTYLLILMLFVLELRDYMKCTENRLFRDLMYVSLIILLGVFGNNCFIYAGF